MAGTPIDLSPYKPVAGEDVDAVKIANGFTAIEGWSDSDIDPASMLQKAATSGQYLGWDGTKWSPASLPTLVAPTMLGPVNPPTNVGVTLTANTAYLYPLPGVVCSTTISRLIFDVDSGGGTGNVDAGIYYSDDESTFTRLVAKGSTATPANGLATLTVSPTVITPVAGRRWYLAFGCSSATPAFKASLFNLLLYSKVTSFPLPASLTAVTTQGAVSSFGVSMMAMV